MKYANAPIKEALFDIRVSDLDITDVHDLKRMTEFLKPDFPLSSHRRSVTVDVTDSSKVTSKAKAELLGFIFASKDSTNQVQIRVDGCTLNIVNSYDQWDRHFETFMRVWNEYQSLFKPKSVVRIATRFINRIELPLPISSFQDYITNIPPIPKCLPQEIGRFFMQTQVPCNDRSKQVIITETIESQSEKTLPFILDIDVFQNGYEHIDQTKIAEDFGIMRTIKNEVFECCITDSTRKLFS